MAERRWDGSASTSWATAANWSGTAVPVDSDDVIFDGNTTQNCITGMGQGAIDLASLTIHSSYTGTIGASGTPLEIEVSGDLYAGGTGDLYVQSASASLGTNGTIDRLIVNTSGNVFLSSFANDGSNTTDFATVIVNSGTVLAYGKAESVATHGGEAGTVIGNLIIAPSSGRGSGVSVTIGEECYKVNGTVFTNVTIEGGLLNMSSSMLQVDMSGGTITHGGTLYSLTANDDTITTLNLHGGTLNWQPSVVSSAGSAGVRTTATAAPIITTANIYAGILDATGMLEKITTAPTITLARLFQGASLNLANGYSEFIVTTLKDYGGNIQKSPSQALTLS
jgi:hypothetical protein